MDPKFKELAAYNTRIAQGIMHTPEFQERMKLLQEQFNLEYGKGEFRGHPMPINLIHHKP